MRYLLKINIPLILVLLAGCATADTLDIDRRIRIDRQNEYGIQFDYLQNRPASVAHSERIFYQYKTARKFSFGKAGDEEKKIIGKGIIEAIDGNYTGAEFLILQCDKSVTDGSIQNNLGIIYEASGKYNEAFTMYTKAILISPEEKIFRSNFLLFLNQNYNEAQEPVKKKKKVE